MIPELGQLASFTPDPETLAEGRVVGFNSRDINSRPFNLLRSQVSRRMKAQGWKLIGITSATPNAGKSFLAANLAAALSQLSDTRVYLFDLDLRRATLASVFGITGERGVSDYLEGKIPAIGPVGVKVEPSELGLFPSFPAHVDSAELFVGQPFLDLVAGMRALPADASVICDLPPVFANDDAMLISAKLDAYLLVVEDGVTTKKQVRDSMRLLEPTPCLGTVLNRYNGGFADDSGYGYGGKYERYYHKPA